MRYHKAVEVSLHQAQEITSTRTSALSDVVIVARGDRYHDVRAMAEAEIKAFVEDLAREEYADLKAAAARSS
ncbi:MAG: hypothetical protein ACK4TP_18205 [Hyphomicrobium sp.]|jgi:hypothetical protein